MGVVIEGNNYIQTFKLNGLNIFDKHDIHQSFHSSRFSKAVDVVDDAIEKFEQEDESDLPDKVNLAPASRGMEPLLNEQIQANKKIPKNVKYNDPRSGNWSPYKWQNVQ